MFGIQPIHILVIVIVAFIIFGPKRLPQIGRSIAKAVRDLRSGMKEMGEGFHGEFEKTSAPPPTVAPPVVVSPPETPAVAAATSAASDCFCTHCGAANPPASRFCHKCGQQLIEQIAS